MTEHVSPMALRRRQVLAGALLAVVAGTSCSSNTGQLTIRLLFPADKPNLLEQRAAFLRIRIDGPNGRFGPVEYPLSAPSPVLEDVPVGRGQELTIDGLLEAGGVAQVRARSGPIDIREGNNTLELLMGEIDRFNQLPATGGRSGMKQGRAFHSATLLDSGTVLLIGGSAEGWRPVPDQPWPIGLDSVEQLRSDALRFDASIDCSGQRCLRSPRVGHSATKLASGSVVVIGGSRGGAGAGPTNRIELFSPDTGKFLDGDFAGAARANHRAIGLAEGALIISGAARLGVETPGQPQSNPLIESVEFFSQGLLHSGPRLVPARRDFCATELPDGSILVTGGFDSSGNPLTSTAVLKAGAPRWIEGPALSVPRAHHTATLLEDGSVLIAGGLSAGGLATARMERIWPTPEGGSPPRIETVASSLRHERWAHTATLLVDGRVLVVGGFRASRNGSPTSSVELLQVGERSIGVPSAPLSLTTPRAGHSATLLPSGLLLVAGGLTSDAAVTASAEVFVY